MTYRHGLFDEAFERDSCGVGLIVNAVRPPQSAIVRRALQALSRLAHRSALGADGKTSDGAGLLCEIPDAFFRRQIPGLPARGRYAVGQIFAPPEFFSAQDIYAKFAAKAEELGLRIHAWRKVPVVSDCLGPEARKIEPETYQVFLESGEASGVGLFLFRRWAEKHLRRFSGCRDPRSGETLSQFYVCSLSTETIVYKGLMRPKDLAVYYPDLQSDDFQSRFAMVHSRFSTNTLPAWELAQPFRFCCHNGEINTIAANRNWMKARERDFQNAVQVSGELSPLLTEGRSDSANFDEAFEALLLTGNDPVKAMTTLVPPPWETDGEMPARLRALYQSQALRMEPWDGPAALLFSDGRVVGASLDRNGLRPCRYQLLKDGTLIAGSEAGMLDVPVEDVLIKSRLRPGQLLSVDLATGEVDLDNKSLFAEHEPDNEIAGTLGVRPLSFRSRRRGQESAGESLWIRLVRFGYRFDEIQQVLLPMFVNQEEATSSMGADTPLALLSDRPQVLSAYFRQLFAQVTNPPIDPIREKAVMSLTTYLGAKPSPFNGRAGDRRPWICPQPFLNSSQFEQVLSWADDPENGLPTVELYAHYDPDTQELGAALDAICGEAERRVAEGVEILVLSDRGAGRARVAIPPLLLVSAIHSHLVHKQLRLAVSLVVEAGEIRDVHQMACLLGFGADAIRPYLVEELCRQLAADGYLPPSLSWEKAMDHYHGALAKGLLKVLSKLGISTLQSYRGAQAFEILGLSDQVVARYFPGTTSRIGGLDMAGIAEETTLRWRAGDSACVEGLSDLASGGDVHFRVGGEDHQWNPLTLSKLQQATRSNDSGTYREFSEAVRRSERFTLRGHLKFRRAGASAAVALDQVEPAAQIVRRFTTGAMSLGALSREAHETLAIAMNRIGGKSNSGEGGEDSRRFKPQADGDSRNSRIKQIASARFGVTIEYLNSAGELQIKMAQGAKPGEGGQLPGHKVDREIARLRHSTPGVTLISPPPHHDIYSIEDLAQLIHDLKRANPGAVVSVKLVSEAGVGTVAAGVAKAMAEKILISGDGGGTGASPLSSIRHAGLPWELGLAEAQQTLIMNGLRGRVRIEVDGQLRTGRDVAIAALLGAEEFGFATAPLVVEGCLMMRKCHLNTCPVGIATQDSELRRRFTGQPEHVVNYFFLVAEELRQIMSELGVAKVSDLVGRTDLLEFAPPRDHWKAWTLDLARLLAPPMNVRSPLEERSERPGVLDHELAVGRAVSIQNTDRSVGSWLSGEVARGGLEGPRDLMVVGSAGQSFGAFLAAGLTLRLIGEANDYVGKGLSGGRLVLRFDPRFSGEAAKSVIAGNTCLYGATSGQAFFAGIVGERFAVRNSGATAVVEGVGEHGLEYMTGGLVVVLGPTGKNFAAGMSGGLAFVYDEDGRLRSRCNPGSVDIEELSLDDESELKRLVLEHAAETRSAKAGALIAGWSREIGKFRKVFPREYRAALRRQEMEGVTA